MRKIVLIFVTVVLPCLLCARNDDKSTDALLRQIDGIIKNRQTYGAEKEARIADLKKLLSEATSDEQRYGFCGRLFDEYRAYNLDSSYVYAQKKQNLASHMGKQDYLDDSAMNIWGTKRNVYIGGEPKTSEWTMDKAFGAVLLKKAS